MSIELRILGAAVLLGILQLIAQAQASTSVRGLSWNFSPRDEKRPELDGHAGRVERIYKNYMESFVFFAIAILLVQITGRNSGTSAAGAWIYIVARVVYCGLYIVGIPVVRTLTWTASMIGIALVLFAAV